MTYIIWNIDPRIFPGVEFIRWYGLCWAIGLLLGLYFLKRGTKGDTEHIDIDKLTIYMIFGALIGARLGHVLFYEPQYYWQHPEALLPFRLNPFEFTGFQGLASHGGVIASFIAIHLFSRKYGHKHLFILDRLIIPGAILGAFIRLGNLMNSEIIGVPGDAPWAFIFTSVDHLPRHPAQLYEALFYLLIFLVLRFLKRSGRFKLRQGALFGIGLTLIFLLRFLIEFIKEDQVAFEGGMALNMGQILSIPMILIGLYFAARRSQKASE